MAESVKDNTWLAPILTFCFILVADLIPITSQLSSMLVVIDEEDQAGNDSNSDYHLTRDSDTDYYNSIIEAVSNDETKDNTSDSGQLKIINGSGNYSHERLLWNKVLSNKSAEAALGNKSPGSSDHSDSE